MFVETAVVLLTAGFLLGIGFWLVVSTRPLERKLRDHHR